MSVNGFRSLLALRHIGDLSKVYPAARSMAAGIGFSLSPNPGKGKRKRLDGFFKL